MQHIIFQCIAYLYLIFKCSTCFVLFLQAVSVYLQRVTLTPESRLSDDVELAHRGFLGPAVLVEPLPVGRGGEDGAVLAAPSVRLQGDLRLPVFEAHVGPRLVHPLAVGHNVVDAQPDLLLGADALADVAVELVILVSCHRGGQAAPFGDAVVAGRVESLLHRIGQETLADDLCTSQTNWIGGILF